MGLDQNGPLVLDMTSQNRLLTRNTLWNLMGQGAPMLVALMTIPAVVRGLGIDRFGLLTLAWMAVGYLGVFDLGMGRALTQLVAQRIGEDREKEIPALAWTALVFMGILGLAGGFLLGIATPFITRLVLKIPISLQPEARQVFYILALAVPSVTLFAGVRGLLEARQQFAVVNLVRIPMGVLNFAIPLLLIRIQNGLSWIVAALVIIRIMGLIVYWVECRHSYPGLQTGIQFDWTLAGPLFRFGGWMTVSNIISPIMVNMDRFFIGAMLGIGMVAYYAAPFEVVTKLLVLPGALVSVLFPMFSSQARTIDSGVIDLYQKGVRWMAIAMGPLAIGLVFFGGWLLKHWVGQAFAAQGTRVTQILAIGILFNSISAVPFSFIQGLGRPDLTAKLHILELPVYLIALIAGVHYLGIIGAAVAWTLRVGLDLIALHLLAYQQMDSVRST
jgi:O-antigen/teichoic acid export membrane protein